MPFNSYTFNATKARKAAWAALDEAREIKARVAAGNAYAWEIPRIESCVKIARLSMHQYLSWVRLREIDGAGKGKVGWA